MQIYRNPRKMPRASWEKRRIPLMLHETREMLRDFMTRIVAVSGFNKITSRQYWKGLLVLGCVAMVMSTLMSPPRNNIRRRSTKGPHHSCAQHDGFIVANMNGRLGNNLFQIALAHRLSQDLCWPIIFRENWQGVFPHDTRANECFPRALHGGHSRHPNSNLTDRDIQWFRYMKIADHFPEYNLQTFYRMLPHGENNEMYQTWTKQTQLDGTALRLASRWEFDYTTPHGWDNDLVDNLRSTENSSYIHFIDGDVQTPHVRPYDAVRTIHLDGFYIHYDWIEPWLDRIRSDWLYMDHNKCCQHHPPANAIVIHIRNFKYYEDLDPGFKPSVFIELLDRMYLQDLNQNKVLWIVCQPDDVGFHLVETLQERYNGTIVPGNDSVDALCILMQARRLVLATSSTFSQMAALLSPHAASSELAHSQEVHYLLPNMREPGVTLVVPHWRYYLVDETTKDTIRQFDVNVSDITPILS
jgi:hypothetical protein